MLIRNHLTRSHLIRNHLIRNHLNWNHLEWNHLIRDQVESGRELQSTYRFNEHGSLVGKFSWWNWTCKFGVPDCTTTQLSTVCCDKLSSRTILSTNIAPKPQVGTLAWSGCSGQRLMPFAIRSHYTTYWPDVEYSRTYVMMPSGVKLSSHR